MKEIITYVAFDDEEFDDKVECEKYEEDAYNKLVKLSECYSFYDWNMDLFVAPVGDWSDVEMMCDWVDKAYNDCEYIRIKQMLPQEVMRLLYNYFGYVVPDKECGLYRYNIDSDDWVKVAD